MVGVYRFFRANFAIGNQTQETDKSELMLRIVDFAAEKGDATAILFGLGQ